jgi:hypothetical protein
VFFWMDTKGPVDCGPGLHFIEADLEDTDISYDVEGAYTGWLWASVNYALVWDVPKT